MAELAPGAKRATLLTFIACLISCFTFSLFLFASWPTATTTKFENNNGESDSNNNNNKIHLVQQLPKDATTPTSGWLVFDSETEDGKRVSSGVVLESISEKNSSKIGAKYKNQKQPHQSEQFGEEWNENVESFRESSSDSVAALVAASGGIDGKRKSNSGIFESLRSSQEKSAKPEGEVEGEENVKEDEAKRKDQRKRSVSGVEEKELARKKRRLERRPILNEFSFPVNLVQGMRFVLMCQVLDSGDSPVHIKWLKDNQEIGSDSIISSNNYSNFPQQQQLTTRAQTTAQSSTTDVLAGTAVAGAGADFSQVELVANEELGALSLVFRKVHQQHSGNYTCMANNHFGSSTYSSFMSVKVPPSWRVEPQDQESIMGEQITIDCQASGNPNPFIRWKFASFQQQQQQQQQQSNNVATHNLMAQKGGQTSQAIPSLTATTTTTDHRIFTSGQFDLAPNQLDLSSFQQNEFQQYQSQHQIFKLINSNHHMQTLENGSLSIRQANKEHEGLYLCEADNGVEPNLVKVIRLIVHLQAQFADEIQLIEGAYGDSKQQTLAQQQQQQQQQQQLTSKTMNGSKSAKVVQNTTQVRLLCQLFGDQPLSLDWLKDGQLIYTHSSGDLSSSLSSSGSSSASSSSASTSALDSTPNSYVSSSASSLALSPLNHPNTEQQQVSSSSSSLSSSFQTRYHVNTRRSAIRPQTGLDSELIIINVRRNDAAMFTCVARNAYGQAERKLRLIVQEPPEAPEVVDVAHIASRSISLRWLAPFDGNSPITKYIIEYRKHINSAPQEFSSALDSASSSMNFTGQSEKLMSQSKSSLEASQLQQQQLTQTQAQVQHTVHDLEPLARYSMRVIAVNSVGKSKPSVALSLRTEEEVPSVVPAMVEATVLSSKSIKLHWTISYSPEREIIDGFFVGYRSFDTSSGLLDQSGDSQLPTVSSSSGGNLLLSRNGNQQTSSKVSEPTFTYKTIRLTNQQPSSGQHLNNLGTNSYQSNIDSNTRQQQQKQQQQQDASAFLTPVSSVTKNLSIQGSTSSSPIQVNSFSTLSNHLQTMQQQQHQQQVVVISTFEYIIGGLDRNTEYTILIQCFNQKGAGPTSDPVVFKTFMNDPPEKLTLNADEITESSVRVSWHFLAPNSIEQHPIHLATKQYNDESLVDGFVLTFTKLEQRNKANKSATNIGGTTNNSNLELISRSGQVNQASPIISNLLPQQTTQSGSQSGIEQWQAIQLAPQQRSHQLKNLECGTSYAMKIWAFNKIGKGEPSDLLKVSTRGKAPVAPDRRSFIATNITQARLHLSAWYDGGCEIDKFMIQYRVRGQQEWILVSNNILKEQLNVVIRDLLPATSYDLFVSAQNQVGPTEVKYRFTTLDLNGKQVSALGHSLLGSIAGGGGDENSDDFSDYLELDGSVRREVWSDSAYKNSLMMFRHLLNSPIALTLSLCLFLALLMLLVFYKIQNSTNSSSETLNLSHKSNGSSHHHHPLSGNNIHRRHSSGEANATILDSVEGGGPMSIANGSIGESPRLNYQSHRLLPSESHYPVSGSSECDHYQTFCGVAVNNTQQRTNPQQQQQPIDFASRSMEVQNHDNSPYMPAYGQVNNFQNAYASVQRSATMNIVAPELQDQNQQQQQCLVQMLMMGPQQQQQQQQQHESNTLAENHNPYMAAALTTLARNKNNVKLNQQNSIYNNNVFHDQSAAAAAAAAASVAANLTLNRQLLDYQRMQQPNSGHYSGKTITIPDGNYIHNHRQQSNNFSMVTMNNNHNNNKQQQQQNNRSDEIYPMSTFKQPQQQQSLAYCSSNSTASTSGTATSGISNVVGLTDNDQTISKSSNNNNNNGNNNDQTIDHFHNTDNIFPFIDSSNDQEQHLILTKSNNLLSQDVDISNNNSNNNNNCIVEQTKICDKTSQYDVPFKFIKASNSILIDVAKQEADIKSETCY